MKLVFVIIKLKIYLTKRWKAYQEHDTHWLTTLKKSGSPTATRWCLSVYLTWCLAAEPSPVSTGIKKTISSNWTCQLSEQTSKEKPLSMTWPARLIILRFSIRLFSLKKFRKPRLCKMRTLMSKLELLKFSNLWPGADPTRYLSRYPILRKSNRCLRTFMSHFKISELNLPKIQMKKLKSTDFSLMTSPWRSRM